MSSPAGGFAFNDYRTKTNKGKRVIKTGRGRLSGGAGVMQTKTIMNNVCGFNYLVNSLRANTNIH